MTILYPPKISTFPPPVYAEARKRWGVSFDSGVVFTYGDTIHVKAGVLDPDLIAHEMVHVKQQTQMGKEIWWKRYFDDPAFRLSQELEAYREQYKYVLKFFKKKKQQPSLEFYAKCLSGKMYGNLLSYEQALEEIQK